MIIHTAQVEDAPAMARVMVDTFLAAHRHQMPEAAWQKRQTEWTYEVSERSWARSLAAITDGNGEMGICYIAVTEAGEVVGLVWGYPLEGVPQTGEIGALYVREHYQGQGIGRRLVQTAAVRLARLGITALHIAVLAANTPARRFYEAIGGRVVDEREVDEEGFLLPAVVYGWPDIGVLLPPEAQSSP